MASTKTDGEGLPDMTPVQRTRAIAALEALQAEHDRLQGEVRMARRHLLERARDLTQQLHDARKAVIEGSMKPSEAEAVAKSFGKEASLAGWTVEASMLPERAAAEAEAEAAVAAGEEGDEAVPFKNFWLATLQAHPMWSEVIQEYDVPVMEYLTDVRCRMHDNWKGYTMTWTFCENPFFSNKTLDKSVYFANEVDGDGRVSIDRLEGTKIDWFPGKDVTVTVKKAKGKGKGKGKKGGSKVEERDSVFRYMSNSINPKAAFEELEDEVRMNEQYCCDCLWDRLLCCAGRFGAAAGPDPHGD
jgi:nucleosome assembly protein 1-like 1